MKDKGEKPAEFTTALIKEKLRDQDQEIATTSCKVRTIYNIYSVLHLFLSEWGRGLQFDLLWRIYKGAFLCQVIKEKMCCRPIWLYHSWDIQGGHLNVMVLFW